MNRLILYITIFLVSSTGWAQQVFGPGNIVVYRVGDGTATLTTSAARVFLDEYTPAGVLVQSIQMPTSGKKITTGNNYNEGLISLSSNGKYLIVTGYNANIGANPFSGSAERSIGVVDFNGMVQNVTVLPNPDYWPIASATSDNGTNLWYGGSDGIEYATSGATSFTKILDYGYSNFTNYVNIANGQLFIDHIYGDNKVGKVGNGLPTGLNQAFSELPGIGSIDGHQFELLDLSPDVPGVDVLYVASEAATGGIKKYSLVSGNWVSNGTIGTTNDKYVGLTVQKSGTGVVIYATRKGANSLTVRGGELVSVTDNGGYNGTLTGTPVVLASVATPNTKSFRGIAKVPQPSPFTGGNIVVYRIGDGAGTLTADNASRIFLDEYTPSGSLVQSLLMPTFGKKLTTGGNVSYGGMLTLSKDGKNLVIPGYNVSPGNNIFSGAAERSIGVVDFNGILKNVTVMPNPDYWPITSATSDDGTNIWYAGSDGLEYTTNGASTFTKIIDYGYSNFTDYVNITNGQLYIGHTFGDNKIGQLGTGMPTTGGQLFKELPGIGSIDPFQFEFADLEPNIPGVDVLYVASQLSTGGGLKKYSLVDGNWVPNGTVGTGADKYFGLAIKVSAGTVSIFATRKGVNNAGIEGGELVKLIDNSGYNGTLAAAPVLIASVSTANSKCFRGISNVPTGCPLITELSVPDISSSAARIQWNSSVAANFEYALTSSSIPPASGAITTGTSFQTSGLLNNTAYFAHVRTVCNSTSTSEWSSVKFVTGCKAPASPLINISINSIGIGIVKWNKVFGSASYEYYVSTDATPPSAGITTNDTSFNLKALNAVTQYYVHVRSNCGGGSLSAWTTKMFTTGCFSPILNLSVSQKSSEAIWSRVNNAIKYEFALTATAAKPVSGTFTTDTSYFINKSGGGSSYYFHVRSFCTGAVSEWSTVHFNLEGLSAYPNPVKDLLKVSLNGLVNPSGELAVGDAMGRVIYRMKVSSNLIAIDTRAWSAGIYLIRYVDGVNKYTMRVLKQ
jgi:hypothetical protein